MPPPIVLDEDEEAGGDAAAGALQRGAVVRIEGLQGAQHLNGQVALVMHFVVDSGRYEVLLHGDGTRKSVQMRNLVTLSVLEEVEFWSAELRKTDLASSMAYSALSRLSALEVSVEVLQRTHVGKVVNEFSRRPRSDELVCEMGKQLVKRWREMFQRQQAMERKGAAQQTGTAPLDYGDPVKPAKASGADAPIQNPGRAGSVLRLPGIEKTTDAPRLVRVMQNAANDTVRLAALVAIEETDSLYLPDLLVAGGLPPLEKWLRSCPACRGPCLRVLQRLPLTQRHIREGRLGSALSLVTTTDTDADVVAQASLLQLKWRSAGLLGEAGPVIPPAAPPRVARTEVPAAEAPAPPERKRARFAEPAAPMPMPMGVGITFKEQPAVQEPGQAAPKPPGLQALQESLLPELSKLDPRITKVLMERPVILEFLAKHRSIMTNMNAQTVAFLVRNLRNSKDTLEEDPQGGEEEDGGTCTVTFSNLHPEVTQEDVSELLANANLEPLGVDLPRESRRQRSCGVALAILPSREAAKAAVRELQGAVVRGRAVRVEFADGTAAGHPVTQGPGSRRICWKQDEELWDVALFDRTESVSDFRDRVQKSTTATPFEPHQAPGDAASARFQAAARKEHEEERKLVRDALAHQAE